MLKDVLKLNAIAQVGGGSGGAKSWNDLTDKPFYTEIGETVLIETTFDIDPENGECYLMDVFSLAVGNTYSVNWNGTEYHCVAESFDMEDVPVTLLGNIGAMTGEGVTEEPFLINVLPAEIAVEMGVSGSVIALDGSTSATVSIKEVIVHPLPAMYLPKMDVTFTKGDDGTITADKTFEQIHAAVNAGYEVTGKFAMYMSATDTTITFCLRLCAHVDEVSTGLFLYCFYSRYGEMDVTIYYGNNGNIQQV